jgi:hypothetical protein
MSLAHSLLWRHFRVSTRYLIALLGILCGLSLVPVKSEAACLGFLFPTISLGAATASVCENIYLAAVPSSPGVVAWAYQYAVTNTSPVGGPDIDYFGVGVGPFPGPANFKATTGPAANNGAPGNFSYFGLVPNLTPNLNGQLNTSGWEFDYFLTGGLGYLADWQDSGAQGALPPGFVGAGPPLSFGPGITETYILYSPYGPVAGAGYVDPLYMDVYGNLGPDAVSMTTLTSANITQAECVAIGGPTMETETDPSTGMDDTDTSGNSCAGQTTVGLTNESPTSIPEPSSFYLLAIALPMVLIGALYQRKRRLRS